MKRALVISGGGSKGAFAGGVAQYLIDELHIDYDIFVGSSTGSLLISHLALGEVEKIKKIYTTVTQDSIFSSCPFVIKTDKFRGKQISINHFNVLKSFLKGKKTFGESLNLRNLIRESLSMDEFKRLRATQKDVVVTVSNLTENKVEYKSIKDFEYDEFCDWVWVSCNYVPFMSLVEKNHCDYADGGLGSIVPIEEAICRGASVLDVIVLDTEATEMNMLPAKNVFSLLTNVNFFMTERISKQNIRIGKLVASKRKKTINFYYTPIDLTMNSLIFDQSKMCQWWEMGLNYARNKSTIQNDIRSNK